ncbi:hypothetical protein [Massilia pseudoviolaceinigra]|uniref:hypothetical protein n=1 Tax=Massilia pseudoviolaceinigra TaxID=3057165 RepID=UPI0027964505|nr:hypothetical protein [Massilia sp. CCM 9206]MDQ1920404.1 hypothetical protein [Massilia sp. CCM 9206]
MIAGFLLALIGHGVIGALDVLINHELIAKVPRRRGAAREQRLHSARELVFAALFGALAWFEWHGVFALAIGALLVLELAISTVDQVLEVDIRTLPPTERAAHVVLFVNLGIIIALLGQQLLAWAALPPALVRVDHGWASWILSGLAIASLGWSVRDGLAASRLRRRSRMGGNGGL